MRATGNEEQNNLGDFDTDCPDRYLTTRHCKRIGCGAVLAERTGTTMPHTIYGQPFPMPCPACKDEAGMPFRAATDLDSGGVEVAMRCRRCQYEWGYVIPAETVRKRESGVTRSTSAVSK